jgi:ABC-type transporter Mla subunit MlaD
VSSEAKVGGFFVIAVLLAGVITVYLKDFLVRVNTYTITAYFANAQGLSPSSEVRFAGARVGKVSRVFLDDNPAFKGRPAAVSVAIFRGMPPLYVSDRFVIKQGALLGDKYVEIERREATPKSKLESGAKVAGAESASLDSLTDAARTLIREASETLRSVRTVVGAQNNRVAIERILSNVELATSRASSLASEGLLLAAVLRKAAVQTTPELTAMAQSLRRTSQNVESTAQLIRVTLATSPVPGEIAQTSANVRQATGDLATMSQNLAAVIGDPATRNRLDGMLTALHESTENLSKLTARAERLASDTQMEQDVRTALTKLRESAESIAVLTAHAEKVFTDPELTADLQATVKGARHATETGAAVAVKADATLDQVDKTMDRVSAITQSIRPTDVRSRATLQGNTRSGLRLDYDLDLQYGPRHDVFWRLGVIDIGDAERLNLQRSIPAGSGARWRVGVFGNKLGVGYDLWQDRRLGLETELTDPNDPRLDVRGLYRAGPNQDLLFGFTDVGQGTDPFLGLRYSKSR